MRLLPFGDGVEPARPRQEVAGRNKKKIMESKLRKNEKSVAKPKNEVATFRGGRSIGRATLGGFRPQKNKKNEFDTFWGFTPSPKPCAEFDTFWEFTPSPRAV